MIAREEGAMAVAQGYFRRAATANAKAADPRINLANLLLVEGKVAAAEALFVEAATACPDFAPAQGEFGKFLAAQGRFAEAAIALEKASDLDAAYLQDLLKYCLYACDWSRHAMASERMRGALQRGESDDALTCAVLGGTPAELLVCTRNQGRRYEKWAEGRRLPPPGARSPGPIRIGYLSGDFHDHPTTQLITDVFVHHDRSRFQVEVFSYGPNDNSPARQRLVEACDNFHDVSNFSSVHAAGFIRAREIDILVDLKGYTHKARPEIVALRPSPVQVNYLGFPGSMAADFIDYVIADRVVCPMEMQPHVREAIVHLPGCFQPNSRRPISSQRISRADVGLPENGLVFASFNTPVKFSPTIFDSWMVILRRRPDSVLWLLAGSAVAANNLRREAEARGVAPDRLLFARHLPLAEHLMRIGLADVCLDTAPIGAFTSASDALWAGVPLVTLLCPSAVGRGAASILTALGCEELIAATSEAYIDLALALADDPARRDRLRRLLLAAREGASIFDTAGFTSGLEAALGEMHRRRMCDEAPSPLTVSSPTEPPRAAAPSFDEFDPLDHRFADDPASLWRDLRERCPVASAPSFGPGVHLLTRYDDVREAAYNPGSFSSRQMIAVRAPSPRTFPSPPITWDPPDHRVGRLVLTPLFSAKVIDELLSFTEATAEALIAQIGSATTCDAALQFAHPLAGQTFARFLGVRPDDGLKLQALMHVIQTAAQTRPDIYVRDMEEIDRILRPYIAAHEEPAGALGRLRAHRSDGRPLVLKAQLDFARMLVFAGAETTGLALAAAISHMAHHQDDRRTLQSNLDSLDATVEEMLRLYTPFSPAREALSERKLRCRTVRKGELVLLSFAAANRDPEIFPDPDVMRLDRERNPHLAFGAGVHRCAGIQLARMQMKVGIRMWLSAFPEFTASTAPTWSTGFIRGVVRLPLDLA